MRPSKGHPVEDRKSPITVCRYGICAFYKAQPGTVISQSFLRGILGVLGMVKVTEVRRAFKQGFWRIALDKLAMFHYSYSVESINELEPVEDRDDGPVAKFGINKCLHGDFGSFVNATGDC